MAVLGIGYSGFKPNTRDLSFREMMFEAATRAYNAAGIDPRRDVGSFISCQEDYWEGISIADEFSPGPIGGVLRPTFTIAGDGLMGIIHGIMQILSGFSEVVVVESHAKPSEIDTINKIVELSLDPIYIRPINSPNTHFLAALDLEKYMKISGAKREDLSLVVEKNKNAGLKVPRSSYAAKIGREYVESQPELVGHLTALDITPYVDASIVAVLASEESAKRFTKDPIFIDGYGWATETALFERAELGMAKYMSMAAEMAKVKGLKYDGVFVDDRYSYKELEHIDALGITDSALKVIREGQAYEGGDLPVNTKGGHLSKGIPLEAAGLSLLLDAYECMLEGCERALVAGWRGFGTFTGYVLRMVS